MPNPHADPPYPWTHKGTVLVCGFGSTFYDDLRRARELRPDAPVIAVNRAAKAVAAFALFSLHPDEMEQHFAIEQAKRFGDGFTTHSGGMNARQPGRHAKWATIDYWWELASGKGTSGWAAQRMAKLMGFTERILVGMPMDDGNYANGNIAKSFKNKETLKVYREFIANDTEWHDGVYGMSGYVRELFGEPK